MVREINLDKYYCWHNHQIKRNVKIWDLDIDKYRKQSKLAVGVVPQELNIDAFTPIDQLELQAGLFNVPKKIELL